MDVTVDLDMELTRLRNGGFRHGFDIRYKSLRFSVPPRAFSGKHGHFFTGDLRVLRDSVAAP